MNNEYSDVQIKILSIKDELENYTNKSSFVKDLFSKKHIFVQDIKTLVYVKVDEILNSFSSIKDEDSKKKMCLIMIQMMIMLLVLKEKQVEKIEDIDIDLFNTYVNDRLKKLVDHVIEKNRKYGNSALNPIRIMSSSSTIEQLYIRLDDKLNRLINRQDDEDEDIPFDIAGYFILIYVHFKLEMNK